MFDFLKRHRKPIPIFETLEVDLHNHMIPCVDDGSESTEMSIGCIRSLWECGFRKMFITPHFNFPRYPNNEEDIKQRYAQLVEQLKAEGVEMEMMGIGGEYQIDDGFAKRMQDPHFLTIGHDNYLLLEISLRHHRMGFENTIEELLMTNQPVILAHPERYLYLNERSSKLEHLKNQGVMFQCNILSIAGFYGHEAQKRALQMIEDGWVEFLATDMHNFFYADALRAATHDRNVQRVLEKYKFMNKDLVTKTYRKL